ncbi:MAG: hypothetical protein KIT84_25385 [Labilithrix sp.]|nr:hypothetical protein [Labilithrix sp.]MCW5814385.1 hypothetical protein [Labilithrix sp.]
MTSLRYLGLASLLLLAGCRESAQASTTPQQQQQPPGYYYPPQQQPYPSQQPPGQQPPPGVQPQVPAQQRPLLAPLIGQAAQEQEVRMILSELINALPAQSRPLVANIPLNVDPTPEVNAFAGCDDKGNPYMAATAGILEAVDAISQTKATDELFGTQTYEAYCAQVLPQLVQSQQARAGLPAGIIPQQYGGDPRRWSRAREIFQDVIAFTFGHELAHHYLGHTGCAKGQALGGAPDLSRAGRLLSNIVPVFNQFQESASDSSGVYNVLDAGRARRPQYEWSEYGGVTLLDYFARLERAAGGGGPLSVLSPIALLKSHPNPLLRIPIVQQYARTWRSTHPG